MRIELRAYANPYVALDHLGRAQGAVPLLGKTDICVGGAVDHEASKAEGKVVYAFNDLEQVLVCSTIDEFAYYKHAFQDGALIPGDEMTASRVRVPWKTPSQALSEARAKAIQSWRINVGTVPACDVDGEE